VKVKVRPETEEKGLKSGECESCVSGLGELNLIKKVECAGGKKKPIRDFLPKNSVALIFMCFFGCLLIVSSTYIIISDQHPYGNGSDAKVQVQKERNIQVCKQVVAEYYESHTYTQDDIYDCDNMAQDVWNMLKAKGINARIAVGDFELKDANRIEDKKPVNRNLDSESSGLISPYNYTCEDTGILNSSMIDNLTHAWVLAEVAPGNWLAIECTGGYVVSSEEDGKYYCGLTFSNPKNYRSFLDLYSNWKKQIKDYDSERLYYNRLQNEYNNANYSEQVNMKRNLKAEEDRLRDKEEAFLKADAEIQALLRYG
jgi:hypothetical protein